MHKTETPPPARQEAAARLRPAPGARESLLQAPPPPPESSARAGNGFLLEQPRDSGLKPGLPGLSIHPVVCPPLRRH